MLQKLAGIIGTLTLSFLLLACDLIQPQSSRPSVVISSPPSGSVYTVGEQVTVQSTATDAAGIIRVELIVDGVTVHQAPSPIATGQQQFSLIQTWTADRVGQRNLIVRATSAQGAIAETGIYVTVQERATAPTVASTNAPTAIPPTGVPTQTFSPSPTTNPAMTVIVTATSAPTATPTNTLAPSPTLTTSVESTACTDNSTFVADVTIPDNTNLSPNAAFAKTWRVRNTGTCNWQNYQLIFSSGSQMNSTAIVPIPATVAGATADISVSMTAPATSGNYKGTWRLQNAIGIIFGNALTVVINVPSPNVVANATATNATATSTTVPPTLPAASACSGQPANFTITASASTINAGQSVTLNWGAVSNASIAVLNGGQFNQQGVGAPGSITATPNTTTTYTLTATCNNGGGTRTNSVTVTVSSSAAACSGTPGATSFTASQTTILAGNPVTLNWTTTNADEVRLAGGTLASIVLPANGSYTDSPSTDASYRLTPFCTANGKFIHTFLSVKVITCNVPSIGSFTASADTITAGQFVTLSWGGIENDKLVQLQVGGDPSVEVAKSGSQTFSPTTTTTYTLRASDFCVGAPRRVEKTVTVTVLPGAGACSGKPKIGSFTASATAITQGQIVTLFWDDITNYDEVRLYSGGTDFESVGPTAQRNRIPNQTTTYELTALCNAAGTSTIAQITVTVNP